MNKIATIADLKNLVLITANCDALNGSPIDDYVQNLIDMAIAHLGQHSDDTALEVTEGRINLPMGNNKNVKGWNSYKDAIISALRKAAHPNGEPTDSNFAALEAAALEIVTR